MRIVFVGAVEFSRRCLNEVLSNGGQVVAALSLTSEHAGSHSDYADLVLVDVATQCGVPVYKIKNINNSGSGDLVRCLGAGRQIGRERPHLFLSGRRRG
jgi:methionyl-tRNA formyltransferase